VLANQFVSQIKDERIMQSVFGNVGTLICFRLGQADAALMEREMFPVFTRSDLISLPNWRAYMATLVVRATRLKRG
jgi:type IV secretory pathway VirB4 component